MLAAIVSKFLAWLGGRGLRILVREVADALEEAEIARDYKIAMQELAEARAGADQMLKEAKANQRMNDADIGVGAIDDGGEWMRSFAAKNRKG